jgi:hypothetical protein
LIRQYRAGIWMSVRRTRTGSRMAMRETGELSAALRRLPQTSRPSVALMARRRRDRGHWRSLQAHKHGPGEQNLAL